MPGSADLDGLPIFFFRRIVSGLCERRRGEERRGEGMLRGIGNGMDG